MGKNNCSLGMKLQLRLQRKTQSFVYILKVASRRSFSTTTKQSFVFLCTDGHPSCELSSGPHSAHLCSYNFGDRALKNKQRLFSSTSLKSWKNDEDGRLHNSSDRIYGEERVGRDHHNWLLQILREKSIEIDRRIEPNEWVLCLRYFRNLLCNAHLVPMSQILLTRVK